MFICVYLHCTVHVHVVHVHCTLYSVHVYFDYVVNRTGSSESADPNTTGGGVTSKGECLVFVHVSNALVVCL